jgi:ubiquinone/menaquinone biosynthesis C-methylase UbiE
LDHGERLIPKENEPWELADHPSRYIFVQHLITDGEHVLEVGSGVGYGLRKLSNSAYISSIGVDINREAILFAKKNCSPKSSLEFAVMGGSKLGFRDNVFDMVFSLEAIEHVIDHREFVKEPCRVLKLGGTYIISTPNKNDSQRYVSCPFHVKGFTKNELYLTLKKHFRMIQIFGKRVKNMKFLSQQERLSRKTINRLIGLALTYFPSVRFLAKYLPET